jgi:hypothetical protein
MHIKNVIGAAAIALLWFSANALAGAVGPDSNRSVATAGYSGSAKLTIAPGTDLRPCESGTHSEFSRLTGGYRCARNQ